MLLTVRRDTTNSSRGKRVVDLRCDTCGLLFTCDHCVKAAEGRDTHFCSQRCVRQSPIVKAKTRASLDVEKLKASLRRTCVARFGAESYFQTAEFVAKRRETLLSVYGVDHQSKSPEVASRQRQGRSRTTSLLHWKTGESLLCEASYEVAFVNWCNFTRIDFDWQVPQMMPDGHVYYVDAFIKTGEFADTWVEIKGYMTPIGKSKWEWFHESVPNSQLWDRSVLLQLGILVGRGRPNPSHDPTVRSVS